MRWLLVLGALGALVACGGGEPPLTHDTVLHCPAPDGLPFRLMSSGFQSDANQTLANNDPRNKAEASDTLGNPGGASASVYLPDDQAPVTTPVAYHGVEARTTKTGGLFSTPLPGENVSLWVYDPDAMAWSSIGRTTTDDSGAYDLPDTGFVAANGQPIYAVLEADGSCAEHYDELLPPGSKFVVTDIDGTLTTSDNEEFIQLGDATYVPKMKTSADKLMQAWAMKGYPIVYLTARPHVVRVETRIWLHDLGFPDGPVITANAVAGPADTYKTMWLERLITTFGWVPVAAYGNADTDITAYANAGIPKEDTFIIGPLAGDSGTVAIPNDDYTQHIATFVDAQPDNN
jgi:hypothetical protein